MKVINNKKPNYNIHIDNKYILNNNSNHDFIINIYYISNNKINILIRKINDMNGWNSNISLQIFDNDNYEIIHLGSSKKNSKNINIYSNKIIFHKKPLKNLKIPKVIFQTNKKRVFENDLSYNSILSFIEFNPSFEYKFFDDKESRDFVKNNFNELILYYYDILYPGAFKADFFRYCYLYINGGFYFDNKSILLCSLEDILNENDELILCQDNHKEGLYNAVMMAAPNNQLFFNLINKIIYKIQNFNQIYQPKKNFNNYKKLNNILSLTGPNLLKEEFNILNLDYNNYILMKHEILGNYQNYKNLVVKFKNKLILYKNYNNFNINNPQHYSKLWIKHHIFYKNYINNNNYIFMVKPIYNYELNFYFIDNKILVISNNKFKNNLDFLMIDENSNSKIFDIPNINKNYYFKNYEITDIFDYSITSINYFEKDYLNNDIKLSINKINNEFYLIIFNKNEVHLNNLEIIINTNIKNFRYEISNLNNKLYKIENITDLFNN